MIIIVEGIDRVGKTTLCNMLKKEMNIPVYKHIGNFSYSNMDNDNETDKMLQILETLRLVNGDVIFDRCHFTDYVYGILERYYNKKNAKKNFSILEKKLSEMHVVLLFVNPTNIEKSSYEHGKDLSMHQKIFQQLYKVSCIKEKYQCTYNTLNEAVIFSRISLNKEKN